MEPGTVEVIEQVNQVEVINEENLVVVEQPATQVIEIDEAAIEIVTAAEQGPMGPQGPSGPPGPSGDLGTDRYFAQPFTGDYVIATHGFGKYPSVTVKDSAGTIIEGEITHIDLNTVMVNFSAPFSGIVICN